MRTNFVLQFSSEISFAFLFLILSSSSSEAAIPACGKVLVARMFDICQATDCNTVTPISAESYAPFDLLTECCLQGCEASRIQQYCCFVPPTVDHGSPFQPRVPLAKRQMHHKKNRFNFNSYDLGY